MFPCLEKQGGGSSDLRKDDPKKKIGTSVPFFVYIHIYL